MAGVSLPGVDVVRVRARGIKRAGNPVIARAGDIQLLLDRVEVVDEAKASPDSRRIADGDLHRTTFWVPSA